MKSAALPRTFGTCFAMLSPSVVSHPWTLLIKLLIAVSSSLNGPVRSHSSICVMPCCAAATMLGA